MNNTTQPIDFLSGYRLTEELPQIPQHLSEHITKLFTLMYRIVYLGQEAQQYMVALGTHYGKDTFDNEADLMKFDVGEVCAKIWGLTYEMICDEAENKLYERLKK